MLYEDHTSSFSLIVPNVCRQFVYIFVLPLPLELGSIKWWYLGTFGALNIEDLLSFHLLRVEKWLPKWSTYLWHCFLPHFYAPHIDCSTHVDSANSQIANRRSYYYYGSRGDFTSYNSRPPHTPPQLAWRRWEGEEIRACLWILPLIEQGITSLSSAAWTKVRVSVPLLQQRVQ